MVSEMDVYGLTAPEFFRIDDLLDFTNEDIFSSTTTDSDLHDHHLLPPPENHSNHRSFATTAPISSQSSDFTDDLCIPSDDIAELEWLSKFVDDSFTDFPANELAGAVSFRSDGSFPGRTRSKRSRAASNTKKWTSSPESETPAIGKKNDSSSASSVISGDHSSPIGVRRCTHCASEKTPQWRTGPLGPKTLCNACGVRYKSGRLVPEYRPATSPTFVLTQHSNSHRKVMELRRQKENLRQQEEQQRPRQLYHHHHRDDFEVC